MVDVKKLIHAVRTLASDNPDNVYWHGRKIDDCCRYDAGPCSNGTIGCIFGQALVEIGEPTTSDVLPVNDLLELGVFGEWCSVVQTEQDNGKTWGKAVQIADNVCPEVKYLL